MACRCIGCVHGAPMRARSWRVLLLMAATVGALVLLRVPRHSVGSTLLVLLAAVLAGLLVLFEHRDPRLGIAPVAVAVAIVIAASVATPPRTSNDLWSYTVYGRMV